MSDPDFATKKRTEEYRGVSFDEAFKVLHSREGGLSDDEAQSRIEFVGYNELPEKRINPAADFLSRLWGPVAWLLELTIILSLAISHYLEAVIILALLLLNAAIGSQRSRASQKALDLLKKRLAVRAKLLRDGKWSERDSRGIVPGDVISIGLGDLVPADAKIIHGKLSVDQSPLTGESLPVSLGESSILYSSSLVLRGGRGRTGRKHGG